RPRRAAARPTAQRGARRIAPARARGRRRFRDVRCSDRPLTRPAAPRPERGLPGLGPPRSGRVVRILFASSEATPYFKTGGLADVARSLPDALWERGHDIRIVHPFYRHVREQDLDLVEQGQAWIPWPEGNVVVRYLVHQPERGAPAV